MTGKFHAAVKPSSSCRIIRSARQIRTLQDCLLALSFITCAWMSIDFALTPLPLSQAEATHIERQSNRHSTGIHALHPFEQSSDSENALWLAYGGWLQENAPSQGHCHISNLGLEQYSLRCTGASSSEPAAMSTRFSTTDFAVLRKGERAEDGFSRNDKPIDKQCQPALEAEAITPEGQFSAASGLRLFNPEKEAWE